MKIEYLVLRPIVLNIHKKGSIYLSYDKKEDAEEDAKKNSKNGKCQIIVLESK